jgi:hypothetical protein
MAMASIDLDAMKSLVTTMGTAATDLRGVKSDLAGTLGGVSLDTSPPYPLETAASWVDGQVPGLRRRLALAQAIAASTPHFKAGSPVSIDESKLSTLSPTEAAKIGKEAADRIKDGGGDGPDSELAGWLSQYASDPYFAAALAKGSSPTEIADYLRTAGYDLGSHSGSAQVDYDGTWKAKQDAYNLTVAGLSTALSTATRSESTDLKLPSSYADDWANAITDDSHINGEAAILGNLMKDGAWGTSFLNTVSTKVYDYETKNMADNDQHWSERTPGDYWYAYDKDGKQIVTRDPMAGIMSALGHNADASQTFFTTGGNTEVEIDGKKVQVNSRLKYLTQDRTWTDSGDVHSDNGDGLGKALRSASTTYRNQEWTGQQSATIASQTIALLGEHIGDGQADGFMGIGHHDGWNVYGGMRDELADIVADYSPDLYRHYGTSGVDDDLSNWTTQDSTLDIPGAPYGLSFLTKDMDKVLGTLGEDSKNMDKISVSVLAFNRARMTYQLQDQFKDHPELKWAVLNGEKVPAFSNPFGTAPTVLAHVLQTGYAGKKNEEEMEKAKAEALKQWLDIAGSIPGLSIPGKGAVVDWANFGVEQIKSQALDQIGKSPETADSLYSGKDVSNKDALQRDTLNLLLQNGFFDDATMAEGNKDHGAGTVYGPPPGALTYDDQGHVKGFNYGSQVYQDWTEGLAGDDRPAWTGKAPGMTVPDDAIQKYDQEFPNIDGG